MGKHNVTKEKSENKKKKKSRHIGRKIFIFILLILAICGGIFAKRVYDLDGNWVAALLGHNKNTLENLDKLYILVMGESTGSSDTIMACSYDPKTQEASILSIPRDTYVGKSKARANASDKINALYSAGKAPEKTMAAVNEITGLNISNYILIDTKALVELVDSIGGIEFDVPIDMKYDDYSQDLHVDLKAGLQKLNGSQVEQLVRFRHNNNGSTYPYSYGIEDYGRMRTQREVIKTIAKQAIQFKNISEIGNIIDIMKTYVKTDMDLNVLKDYLPYAIKINMDGIKTMQLPGTDDYINGYSFFLHNAEETKTVVQELFYGVLPEETNDD